MANSRESADPGKRSVRATTGGGQHQPPVAGVSPGPGQYSGATKPEEYAMAYLIHDKPEWSAIVSPLARLTNAHLIALSRNASGLLQAAMS